MFKLLKNDKNSFLVEMRENTMTWLHDIILSNESERDKVKNIKIALQKSKNPKEEAMAPDSNGFSPLFIAILQQRGGHKLSNVCKLLQSYGATLNEQDQSAEQRLDKSLNIRSLFDVAVTINNEPVERYPEAARPTHLTVTDCLPYSATAFQQVPLLQFEQEIGKKWVTTYMVPRGVNSFLRKSDSLVDKSLNEEFKLSVQKTISEPCNNMIIATMHKFGKGIFTGKGGIPAGTGFFYGALLQRESDPSGNVYSRLVYSDLMSGVRDIALYQKLRLQGADKGNATLNGDCYFNFSVLMQHLISKKELQNFYFKFPNMQHTIATENISNTYCNYKNNLEWIHFTTEDIPELNIVGFDYGVSYWRAKNTVPAIFDKKGRYISPAFYSNRPIFVRTSSATRSDKDKVTANYVEVTNDKLEEIAKGRVKPGFEVDLKWLVEQDIIPNTEFLKQFSSINNELQQSMLEIKLIAAAGTGDLNTLRALLEYHQPRVNINAQNKSNLNTALHYAVIKGHFYAVLYLLIQGSATTLKNIDGKTPIECTTDIEIKEAIAAYAALAKTPAAAENSQAKLIAAVGFCATRKIEKLSLPEECDPEDNKHNPR